MFMRKSSKHPVQMKTSWYVNIPFFMAEEQGISEKSNVIYERIGNNQLVIRIGGIHD